MFPLETTFCDEEGEFEGTLKDIGFGGAYIVSKKKVPVGKSVNLKFILRGAEPPVEIKIKSEVVREGNDGFAVRFVHIDFQSLSHLRKLFYYNIGDPEVAEKELKTLLGEAILEIQKTP